MYTAIHASCSSRSRTVQGESTNSRPRRRVSHDITYEKCARKSPRTHTYKIIGLKPSWNHTLTKNPGGTPASCILASAIFLCRILAATRSMQCADAALPPPYQATEGRRVRLQSRHAQGKLKL